MFSWRQSTEAAAWLAIASGWLGVAPYLIGLRIDSTVRGPIAASIDAMLAERHRSLAHVGDHRIMSVRAETRMEE